MPRCVITRRAHFSAAHRLWNPRFSDAENAATFGVCNNPNYHGHNYDLDVSVEGEIDPDTGYVLDVQRLKDIATECLVRHLDHKNLNELEPFVEEQNPSAENLARFILERLAVRLDDDRVKIYKVRCFETPTSVATYQVE